MTTKRMNLYSGLLYSEPTFLRGVASILDLGGNLLAFNVSPTDAIADMLAIRSDWRAVGGDIGTAMNEQLTLAF